MYCLNIFKWPTCRYSLKSVCFFSAGHDLEIEPMQEAGGLRQGLSRVAHRVPKPGPRGAEATLGAPASPPGQTFGNRGLPAKARLPPKKTNRCIEIAMKLKKSPATKRYRAFLYPGRDLNPHGHHCPQDFKSCVSTDSTTRAIRWAKVQKGLCSSSLFEFHFLTFVQNEGETPSVFLLK